MANVYFDNYKEFVHNLNAFPNAFSGYAKKSPRVAQNLFAQFHGRDAKDLSAIFENVAKVVASYKGCSQKADNAFKATCPKATAKGCKKVCKASSSCQEKVGAAASKALKDANSCVSPQKMARCFAQNRMARRLIDNRNRRLSRKNEPNDFFKLMQSQVKAKKPAGKKSRCCLRSS